MTVRLISIALVLLAGCEPPMSSDAGTDAVAIDCDDLSGGWSTTVSRCGPAIVTSDVTIDVDADCSATLSSPPGKGLPPLNGTVSLEADGSFGPTDLVVGSNTLSCTGAPASATRYVVSCDPGCSITLER